jgi:gluconate 2-dehydrogenase gamma chain
MIERRKFLAILAATVAASRTHGWPRSAFAAQMEGMSSARPSSAERAYVFFTDPEIAFIKAAVARLIPADELGPGAVEAGVPYFLDRQLASAYGGGAHFYNQGPFGSETPYQGYQLPLTPAELYRVGIAATDQYCREAHGKVFAELEPDVQDQVLSGLQGIAAAIDLKEVPGTTFFATLLGDTQDGFFADPAYGGNKDMVGWKLVGFPGVAYDYSSAIGQHNKPYVVAQPQAMSNLQQAAVSPVPEGRSMHSHADATESRPQTTLASPQAPTEVTEDWRAGQRIFV